MYEGLILNNDRGAIASKLKKMLLLIDKQQIWQQEQ